MFAQVNEVHTALLSEEVEDPQTPKSQPHIPSLPRLPASGSAAPLPSCQDLVDTAFSETPHTHQPTALLCVHTRSLHLLPPHTQTCGQRGPRKQFAVLAVGTGPQAGLTSMGASLVPGPNTLVVSRP